MLPLEDENVQVSRPPIVNLTIIILNIIIFFIGIMVPSLLVPGARSYNDVVSRLGMVPARIVEGEALYTVFTAMFLHGGFAHLFGNMLYLYIFGDNIEAILGRVKYLIFYIASGIGAVIFHILSIAMTPDSAIAGATVATGLNPWLIPAIGASGAISGVLGAYLIAFPHSQLRVVTFWVWIPFVFQVPAAVYIVFWFIYQLIMGLSVVFTGVQAGVAFWAHIGGFLTGMALLPLMAKKADIERVNLLRARML